MGECVAASEEGQEGQEGEMTNRLHMEPKHRDGPGTVTWLMLAILAVLAAALYGCG